MPILYLIRHGEPEIRGVFPGAHDPPLAVRGKEEVRRRLSSLTVSVAYTSPARRARETAECVAASRLIELPGLREINYGLWSGLRWEEIGERWSALAAAKCRDWLGVAAPDGERWGDVLARAAEVLQTIRQAPSAPAAVVAHQGINAALISLIDGRNPLEFVQSYGEVVRVKLD
jgi:broad specificity phosphatase PhoE